MIKIGRALPLPQPERDWLDSLQPPVLVVGNAPLRRWVPEEAYRSIVRINNFVLGGKSGQKVTHWVANGYKDIEPRPVSPVLVPWSREYQLRPVRYDLDFAQRINTEVIHLPWSKHITLWFPRALYKWKLFPSVGFCFLAWLHSKGVKPDIIGFDGMMTGHHLNYNHRHGHKRTKVIEWQIIQSHFIRRNLQNT